MLPDACVLCETVFDGDTPRTTPGCELCETCEACGCQLDLDTLDEQAAEARTVIYGKLTNLDDWHLAKARLATIKAHQAEVA